MSFNFANFTKDLKSFGDKISTEFNKEVVPLAQRTTRLVQEKIGNVNPEEISQLPSEYLEIARKCNSIEHLYKNVLKVTTTYESEPYDYPSNLQESFNELGKDISSRVSSLSKATSASEAQAALVHPKQDLARPPKTLYHAISRATDPAILAEGNNEPQDINDPLVKGLTLYSNNLNKIANARLGQDQLIKTKFNKPLTTTLRSLISQSTHIQKRVEEKRIDYDLARKALTNCSNPNKESQLRVDMENAEDEFANTVEDAINIMQNVLENAKPLHEFVELIKAQLAYHKLANELLGSMVEDFEQIIEDSSKQQQQQSQSLGPDSRESGDFDI
ncbi:Protein GVP36 [Spathaspora sp. JA1]|nr:Protein GVP36 [Spathaspora sp. JA1]